LTEAFDALEMDDIDVFDTSKIVTSKPVGPSQRIYANAAATISSDLDPLRLLIRLKAIEHHFGRRHRGQSWRPRVLDLDIILWSGGIYSSDDPALAIPHPHMCKRGFVLGPAAKIAPDWHDPVSGFAIKHLFHRLNRPKPLDASDLHH
jgi:2-amino-4-hydroxy-6-hydroxymethyldihydropteridine diphosphokinase